MPWEDHELIVTIAPYYDQVRPLEAVGYAVAMLGVAAMASVIAAEGPDLGTPRGDMPALKLRHHDSDLNLARGDLELELEVKQSPFPAFNPVGSNRYLEAVDKSPRGVDGGSIMSMVERRYE